MEGELGVISFQLVALMLSRVVIIPGQLPAFLNPVPISRAQSHLGLPQCLPCSVSGGVSIIRGVNIGFVYISLLSY